MCTCIKKISESCSQQLKDTNKEAIISGGQILEQALFVDGGWATTSSFEYKIQVKKKDNTHAKEKTKVLNLLHQFCPFCGVKYDIKQ